MANHPNRNPKYLIELTRTEIRAVVWLIEKVLKKEPPADRVSTRLESARRKLVEARWRGLLPIVALCVLASVSYPCTIPGDCGPFPTGVAAARA